MSGVVEIGMRVTFDASGIDAPSIHTVAERKMAQVAARRDWWIADIDIQPDVIADDGSIAVWVGTVTGYVSWEPAP